LLGLIIILRNQKKTVSSMSKIFELIFPEELSGVEIEGVDVQMLALDAVRLVDYFFKQSTLTEEQHHVLKEIHGDLPKVVRALSGGHKKYFQHIQQAVSDVMNVLKEQHGLFA